MLVSFQKTFSLIEMHILTHCKNVIVILLLCNHAVETCTKFVFLKKRFEIWHNYCT